MSDTTFILRHYHDDCASSNLSLTNQIQGMEANSIVNLYADFRSVSRGQRQHLRKRQLILNTMFRTKHCHRDCLSCAHRAISSRQRHQRDTRAECTDETYWDKECADLEHRERTESSDLLTLFYNHGHNAEVIEPLRPKWLDSSEDNEDAHDWIHIADDVNAKLEAEGLIMRNATLYLNPHPFSPTSESISLDAMNLEPDHFPTTTNCAWAKTPFAYYRNLTGLWELGYASRYTAYDPSGSLRTTSSNAPDLYACTQPTHALHEEMQKFPHLLGDAETGHYSRGRREKTETEGRGEWAFVRAPPADREVEQWDVVSALSSTGSWRIVDVT